MSILDFVKEAGHALGIGGDDKPTPEALKAVVQNLGFDMSGLDVGVDGDKAVVSGQVPSQEEKEKIAVALGNVKGIASVEDNLDVQQSEAPQGDTAQGGPPKTEGAYAASFYTVQAGDTLSGISKKVYGEANEYEEIFKANQPMLSDPNKIYPGQVLRIPSHN